MRKVIKTVSKIVAAVTAAVLLSTAVGHAKRIEFLHRKHTVAVTASAPVTSDHVALVIANSRYPDADAPLAQLAGDASSFANALRSRGFKVDVVTNATRADMAKAIDHLGKQVRAGGTVALYLGGYGVQSRGRNYLIPVDAAIWRESDVRKQGVDIDDALSATGAKVKFAYVDAARRNPYERRFRAYSHGLAPIAVNGNVEVVTSAAPDHVVEDIGQQSPAMAAIINRLRAKTSVADAFAGDTHEAAN